MVAAGAGKSEVDCYQLGFEASLHPSTVVEPLFGDLPVSYSPENLAQPLSASLPRIRKFIEAFPGTLEISILDYVMRKGAGNNYAATVPAGTATPISSVLARSQSAENKRRSRRRTLGNSAVSCGRPTSLGCDLQQGAFQ